MYIELFENDTPFGYISIYLLTFWTYILPFVYKYYNLYIYIAIWTYIL